MLAALSLLAVAAQVPPPPVTTILIKDVNVVDCVGNGVQTHKSVLIRNGRIEWIRGKTDDITDAQVIDGAGKYLMPGLWDMHVHGTAIPGFLGIYLANGVLGVRDMFEPGTAAMKLRDGVRDGKVLGPHIVCAGRIVDGPQPIWPGSVEAGNATEGRKAVETVLGQGSDFVKVYSKLPRDAYFAIADECKKRHVVFAGHVPDSITAEEASDAGQKSFEHMFSILRACTDPKANPTMNRQVGAKEEDVRVQMRAMLDNYSASRAQDLFAKFKRNGTWQCPTFTVLYAFSHPKDSAPASSDRFSYLPVWMKGIWNNTPNMAKGWTEEDDNLQDRFFKKNLEVFGKLYHAGVPVMAGTDVMNPYCMPGFSLHDELAWFVAAGLKPIEALKAATINPAIYLGIQKDYGTVQRGKAADLILLSADPLADIHNTMKIDAVIFGGRLLDRAKLDQLMPKTS